MALRTLFATVTALLLLSPAQAGEAPSLPGPLVTAEWLAAHRDHVTILDARTDLFTFEADPTAVGDDGETLSLGLCDSDPLEEESDGPRIRGHIPGAVHIDRREIQQSEETPHGVVQWLLADTETFQAVMRAAGVSNNRPVVVTGSGLSDSDVAEAARLVWALRHYGHRQVALLDGGSAAWDAAGHPIEAAVRRPPIPGDFTARPGTFSADTAAVAAAAEGRGTRLVDTRPTSFYRGIFGRDYVRGKGHIPGAVNFPFSELTEGNHAVRTRTPAFLKTPEALATLAREAGIDTGGAAILYCNSGNQASLTWFVLHEVLGMENVRMYDGSLHAWTRDPTRQLVTP